MSSRWGPEARKGAIWAVVLTVVWAAIIGGVNLKSGFGLGIDLLFALLIAALGIPLVLLAVTLVFTIVRKLPRALSGFFVGAFLFVSLLWYGSLGYWMAAILLLLEAVLGATRRHAADRPASGPHRGTSGSSQ